MLKAKRNRKHFNELSHIARSRKVLTWAQAGYGLALEITGATPDDIDGERIEQVAVSVARARATRVFRRLPVGDEGTLLVDRGNGL